MFPRDIPKILGKVKINDKGNIFITGNPFTNIPIHNAIKPVDRKKPTIKINSSRLSLVATRTWTDGNA